jgi:predicted RNA methylase
MNFENNKKYENIKYSLLFPYIEDKNLANKLQIDKTSVNLISTHTIAKKITDILINQFKEDNINQYDVIITDATACVGGNTISFAQNFKYVYAIEIENDRFNYLNNNLNIYKLTNVKTFNDDCLNIINNTNNINKCIAVFFDPPWGGSNYKHYTDIILSISNVPIEEICNDIFLQNINIKYVILKLPKNYNISYFNKQLSKYTIFKHELYKMYIIIIKKP